MLAAITTPAKTLNGVTWAVVEYHIVYGDAHPPTHMALIACPVRDAFTLVAVSRNSYWRSAVQPEHNVLVMIHYVGTKTQALGMLRILKDKAPIAHLCDVHGSISQPAMRTIRARKDDTVREFQTQADCAEAFGVTPAAVSQCLRGHTQTVKGWTVTYVYASRAVQAAPHDV